MMQSNRSNIASSHASLQAPNSDEQPKKVIQDDDIWMSDGNLVIAVPCEDEDTVHIFKCHKSILATRSSVFESMFTLPQTETTETYEGLPVVQLRDDPKAMKALLKFLYNPTTHPLGARFHRATQEIIEGPLRLATKYEMDDLREHLISVLKLDWPTSLEEWDKCSEAMDTIMRYGHPGCSLPEYFPPSFPDPIGIIRLAQELNIPEILPVAFYHLNRAYKVYPLPLDGLPIQATPETCVNTSILTVQDLKRLCIGKQRMVNMVHSFPFDLLERVSDQQEAYHPDCEYALADPPMADICGEKAKESLQVEKFLQELFIGGEDPLRDLSEAYKRSLNYRPTGVVCNSCERCIYDFFQGTRNMIWENLGKCFELEGDGGHL